MSAIKQDPKIDEVLNHCGQFEAEDFALLALAAIDQAGVRAEDWARIKSILRKYFSFNKE